MNASNCLRSFVTYDDWHESIDIIRKYGLLPADSIHVAITMKILKWLRRLK